MRFRISIDPQRCKSCELCTVACPKGIMVLSKQTNAQGFRLVECTDPKQCTGCAACALVCPDVAIEIIKEDEA